jgi:malate dehydrogenase (oxaloacetate-decarboxylating)
VIAEVGFVPEHVSLVRRDQDRILWEITVEIDAAAHGRLVERLNALPATRFVGWSDRAFDRHRGGKIEMRSRVGVSSAQILRDIYTPGVARVCLAIREAPRKALVVCTIAPSFGALLLVGVSAPRCFEIEQKLRARLPLPVLHDDQHGTAVVVLAALLNATKQIGVPLSALTIGVVGLGAAGLGIARLLQAHGVKRLVGTDVRLEAMGRLVQLHGHRETLERILATADAVICTTGATQLIAPERIRSGQIIFALSNPDPEIEPAAALAAGAAIAADGKSISDTLCFPGLFHGALTAHALAFSDAMLLAAARAIATAAPSGQLLPDPLERAVHERVSEAVQKTVISPVPLAVTPRTAAPGQV